MTAVAYPTTTTTGEHIRIPLWTWAMVMAGMFLTYVVLQENGWVMSQWMVVHEFFHDGRHALGFPCH